VPAAGFHSGSRVFVVSITGSGCGARGIAGGATSGTTSLAGFTGSGSGITGSGRGFSTLGTVNQRGGCAGTLWEMGASGNEVQPAPESNPVAQSVMVRRKAPIRLPPVGTRGPEFERIQRRDISARELECKPRSGDRHLLLLGWDADFCHLPVNDVDDGEHTTFGQVRKRFGLEAVRIEFLLLTSP
jgi:hypothetical protein